MAILSIGIKCEVCEGIIFFFSEEESGMVASAFCQKCGNKHSITLMELCHDNPQFCCGYELFPYEFDRRLEDYNVSITCATCGGENDIFLEDAFLDLEVARSAKICRIQ